MIQSIKNKLSEKHGVKMRELNLVKTRGGGKGKILFFAFSGRQKLPFLCAKTSSLECHNFLIESEFNNLKSARNSLPDNLKSTIPEPLELSHIDGHAVGLEEFITGRQAGPYMGSADLEKVFNWLCEFHKANIVGKTAFSKELLINFLSEYQTRIPFFANEPRFIGSIRAFVDIMWQEKSVEMPLIKQHGDFHFANIFFSGDTLKVIDWANYGKVSLPAYDLAFLLKRQNISLEPDNEFLLKYFDFFSMSRDVIPQWLKLMLAVEGLEKWSRAGEFFSPKSINDYFKNEFSWLKK